MDSFLKVVNLLSEASSYEEINNRKELIFSVFPELISMISFNQENKYHLYDLWEHTIRTLVKLKRNDNDKVLYLATLFHDIGKIDTKIYVIKNGKKNTHYYGHALKSTEIVAKNNILRNKLCEEEFKRLLFYVKYHDTVVGWPYEIYHYTKIVKWSTFKRLMWLQVADAKTHKKTIITIKKIIVCTMYSQIIGFVLYYLLKMVSLLEVSLKKTELYLEEKI